MMTEKKQKWGGKFKDNQGNTYQFTFDHVNFQPSTSSPFTATGSDHQGPFQMDGNYNAESKTLTFVKKNATNQVMLFKGAYGLTTINGPWGQDEKYDKGQFTIWCIEAFKGWNGFYSYQGEKYPMKFQKFHIDQVPQGKIIGSGTDTEGHFQINGSFNYITKTAKFVKQYTKHHRIYYSGDLNNSQIKGYWAYKKGGAQDEFYLFEES